MTTIIEKIRHRLGYYETVVIDRDEYNELEALIAEGDSYADAQYEAEKEKDATQKQLDLARGIIDGIVECIDDEGEVTADDKKILARRIVAAVKFVNNLEG